eukprot:6178818-Pleurochrysis_carterae.AAC.5
MGTTTALPPATTASVLNRLPMHLHTHNRIRVGARRGCQNLERRSVKAALRGERPRGAGKAESRDGEKPCIKQQSTDGSSTHKEARSHQRAAASAE